MKAMVLKRLCNVGQNDEPLELSDLEKPTPAENEILIKVSACGVCHTELDEIEGRTPPPKLPVVLGHQVVGQVEEIGSKVKQHEIGDRVGVAWIFSSCGECQFCLAGDENLCPHFKATGRDVNGGYAQYMTVGEAFAFPIPKMFSYSEAAPLLCAGAIGYRSLRLTNLKNGQKLGLMGFGASAHLVLKLARYLHPESEIFAFARDERERKFARGLGAVWAGDIGDNPTEKLHAIIDTTPVWRPVVAALGNLLPGGRLVINAIRKEDSDKDYLRELDYTAHLWEEKEIKSVANVARRDVREFLQLAAEVKIIPEVQEFALEEANRALREIKYRKVRGAKVLKVQ